MICISGLVSFRKVVWIVCGETRYYAIFEAMYI